jgi:hypothetical protein
MSALICQLCGEDATECRRPIVDLVEARAALLAELEAGVRGLPAQPYSLTGLDTTTDSRLVNRAAVLDLIRKAGQR